MDGSGLLKPGSGSAKKPGSIRIRTTAIKWVDEKNRPKSFCKYRETDNPSGIIQIKLQHDIKNDDVKMMLTNNNCCLMKNVCQPCTGIVSL